MTGASNMNRLLPSPSSSSINFRAYGNTVTISNTIVNELASKRLGDVQAFVAESKQNKEDGKFAIKIRDNQFNDSTYGLVVTEHICEQGIAAKAARVQEAEAKAKTWPRMSS